jgi:hypothetical protein
MQRLLSRLYITHIIFTLSSHGSLTERTVTRETRSTLTNTGSCVYTRQRCTNADVTTDQPRTSTQNVSTHLYRCVAPLQQRGLGDSIPASDCSKVKSQLHSARRQTTWAKIISEKTVVDAKVRSRVPVEPGHPITGLQGTGPAVCQCHTLVHNGLFPALLQESGIC